MSLLNNQVRGTSRSAAHLKTLSRERVVVAMSGGVDSSVAAALLVERGYEVIGVMMRLWAEEGLRDDGVESANRCCSPEAVEDARRVCQILGIPFYLINVQEAFRKHVVDYFIAEYERGRTPNPCLVCNRYIKFDLLLRRAMALDARYLATGHYARIARADGFYRLLRGVDRFRDQSYLLYMLTQAQLRHILFPLGEHTKEQVRALARKKGLPVADKDESREICFVLDNDYRRFLQTHAPQTIRPGPILNTTGQMIGQHKGLPFYTIGQRHGLGIPFSEPLYVLEIDAERNALIVGPAGELGRRELVARQVNFISGQVPAEPMAVTAKIRYQHLEAEATITTLESEPEAVRVSFAAPQRDITPGQGVVFYRGEEVIGGGIIA
ncbi:MAG: tRNA 2-thiouridine(34) synthase MnmA [Anaerolineae bacterium]